MKSSFKEYVDSKGKIGSPIVDISGDRTDPMTSPNKPPKAGKPYKCSDGNKLKSAAGKGFGDLGDSELKVVYDQKSKGKEPAKIPTVEGIEVGTFVADVIAKDPTVVEHIVNQIKRRGLLGPLVAELLEHRETCSQLAAILVHETHGADVCRKLARCMNEEVAPPFHDQLAGEEEEEGEEEGGDQQMANANQSDGEGIADPSVEMDDMNVDPAMGGDMSGDPMDPAMGGAPMPDEMGGMQTPQPVDPMMQMPQQQPANVFMKAFQRAMMRRHMKMHMKKNMRKA